MLSIFLLQYILKENHFFSEYKIAIISIYRKKASICNTYCKVVKSIMNLRFKY